jgi:phosphatidylinositol glycan class M
MDAHSAIRDVLWRGTSVRVALVVLSCVLDELPQLHVRYTDVDYSVFTDASRLLADARSPFERATFRYSPLLALVLLPNVYVHQSAGKLLFCAADMAVAYCIYLLNLRPSKAGVGYSEANAARRARLWAYNPLAIAICTRGSCDSLTSLAVLSVLYLLQLGRSRTAAVLYGLCVHFRVYPLIYSVALFLCIARRGAYRAQLPLFDALRSAEAWAFAAVSIACCGACTLASYSFCGKEYIREALLYHLTRTVRCYSSACRY